MQLIRPVIATHPCSFGRGRARIVALSAEPLWSSEDFKLFATTFVVGFVFVSILISERRSIAGEMELPAEPG